MHPVKSRVAGIKVAFRFMSRLSTMEHDVGHGQFTQSQTDPEPFLDVVSWIGTALLGTIDRGSRPRSKRRVGRSLRRSVEVKH